MHCMKVNLIYNQVKVDNINFMHSYIISVAIIYFLYIYIGNTHVFYSLLFDYYVYCLMVVYYLSV